MKVWISMFKNYYNIEVGDSRALNQAQGPSEHRLVLVSLPRSTEFQSWRAQ